MTDMDFPALTENICHYREMEANGSIKEEGHDNALKSHGIIWKDDAAVTRERVQVIKICLKQMKRRRWMKSFDHYTLLDNVPSFICLFFLEVRVTEMSEDACLAFSLCLSLPKLFPIKKVLNWIIIQMWGILGSRIYTFHSPKYF